MNIDIKAGFVGGDARQIYCAAEIAERGAETALFGCENFSDDIGGCTRCANAEDVFSASDIIVFPLPASVDGTNINMPLSEKKLSISDALEYSKNAKIIVYGGSNAQIEDFCAKNGITAVNYASREDFQIMNAQPTAEGAAAIAVENMKKTIFGSKVLCIGYGRIGKVLCRILNVFGAEVYACARRSESRAWAVLSGCKSVDTESMCDVIGECDLIFNTAAQTLVSGKILDKVKKDALIIDLASKPGGIDFVSARQKGLNVIWALSLPGKYSPVTAGKILADTIIKIIEENDIIISSKP